MTARPLVYLAAPVRPTAAEIAHAKACGAIGDYAVELATSHNVERAWRWFVWLRKSWPNVTFVAPWIAQILMGDDDSDPAQRERGLLDCETAVRRCDGLVLVGGRLSDGMRRESAVARTVVDLLWLSAEPPAGPPSFEIDAWRLA